MIFYVVNVYDTIPSQLLPQLLKPTLQGNPTLMYSKSVLLKTLQFPQGKCLKFGTLSSTQNLWSSTCTASK